MTQNGIVLVVSVSIIQDNEVLIIKENKPTAQNKWNFPSGRIEQGEDILVAARREVKEETGFDVKLVKSTGVYNFTSNTNHQVILFHFIGEITGGSLTIDETEIIDNKWISLNKLKDLDNEKLRDAPVIKQIMDALIKERVYPITFFREQLI